MSAQPPHIDPLLLEQQRRLNRKSDMKKVGVAIGAAAAVVLIGLVGAAIAGDSEDGTEASPESEVTSTDRPAQTPPATTATSPEATASAPSPDPASASEPAAPVDDRVWPGGQPLSEYTEYDSYPWRVNVLDNQAVLLSSMQAIAPHLDEGDFGDVISTCDNFNGGGQRDRVNQNGVIRFSGGSDEQVSLEEATQLVDLSLQYACPEFG